MIPRTRRVARLLELLLLLVLAIGLSACATPRPVRDTETTSEGPTVYGKISVSVDHVSTH